MRDYLVYIKETAGEGRAYVTPCYEVDQAFWQDECGLHVVGRSTSLALTVAVRDHANMCLHGKELSEKRLIECRRTVERYVEVVNRLYEKAWRQRADRHETEPFTFTLREPTFPKRIGSADHLLDTSVEHLRNQAIHLHPILTGRSLLWEEVHFLLTKKNLTLAESTLTYALQWMVLSGLAEWLPGITLAMDKQWGRTRLRCTCQRCGADGRRIQLTICHSCRQPCAYCLECLQMGRSKCCVPLICTPTEALPDAPLLAAPTPKQAQPLLQWSGQYSLQQAEVAKRARQFVEQKESSSPKSTPAFLIWAVCGAGKTELIFPSIEQVLNQGGSVCIATPRKDVVLELAPRLRNVFPTITTLCIHGASQEKWERGDLMISTTHQMMRFYRRFDLVIVDEVDAFPYHNNPSLYRAVARAVKPDGKILYLSATPPAYLQKQLVSQRRSFLWGSRLALVSPTHVILPGRYHGHPLPVPQAQSVPNLMKKLHNNRAIADLLTPIRQSFAQDRQVFLFVPRVEQVERMLHYLQRHLPTYANEMAGVHAADPERDAKVLAFRQKTYRLLVTTTILERGVTIPRSDCIVVGADAPIFDEASLVQIAGRVGRSKDAPNGLILFLMAERTSMPYRAIRQIRRMNRLAATWQKERSHP